MNKWLNGTVRARAEKYTRGKVKKKKKKNSEKSQIRRMVMENNGKPRNGKKAQHETGTEIIRTGILEGEAEKQTG